MKQGRLVICATPIGNLGDVTLRVLEALRSADVICAEDTRVTGKLLAANDINKRIERLDEETLASRVEGIIDRIRGGEIVAYCSDAGMPGVSDPGLRLVAAARDADVAVEVLPGASAVQTAYVASGFVNTHYYFGGFFPRKTTQQHNLLESLRTLDAVLIFYESPHRIVDALEVIAEVFPLREVAVCRELTKLHEEVVCDRAPQVAEEFRGRSTQGAIKGEIVFAIDAPNLQERERQAAEAISYARARAEELSEQGIPTKEATKILTDEFDLSRNKAYELVMKAIGSK